jgi:hypothetical protein
MKLIKNIILYSLVVMLIDQVVRAGETIQPPEFYHQNPYHAEGGWDTSKGLDVEFNVRLYADPFLGGIFMSATDIEWDIKKPGIYATNGIALIVITNKAAQITFQGAENLVNNNNNNTVPTYYAFSDTGWLPKEGSDIIAGEDNITQYTNNYNLEWIQAPDLAQLTLDISPPANQLITKTYYIWNKINVDFHTPPGLYQDPDGFVITVTFSE